MDDFFGQYGELLGDSLQEHKGKGGEAFLGLSQNGVTLLAKKMDCSARQAMIACLNCGIWPSRFCRNRGLLTAGEQARLLQCHAAVFGCGGLGGYAMTALARLGLGSLTICDYDVFSESNLNRQVFCYEDSIGMPKAVVAQNELARIASHTQVRPITCAATVENLPQILQGTDIAVDCLDNFASRLALEKAAAEAGIPLVHGTLAGYEGFVFQSSQKTEAGLHALCHEDERKGAENRAGVPVFTVAAIAAMQTVMAMRILLGRPGMDQSGMWHLDLSVPEVELLSF